MRVLARPSGDRGISPALPAVGYVLLALLWGLSTLGGWADDAFCAESGPSCSGDLRLVIAASTPFAALGVVLGVVALRRWAFLPFVVAALAWVAAGGVVFVGGFLVQP
ncbi:hypothetical protein [Actinomadura flavalba]|uniref:hypothetical protein n=1 Tax=Actinomadura flavalba TaxID=1120938 RepID=UPI00036F56C2|nr:hypothetical protein [Actinomadura flavalba]